MGGGGGRAEIRDQRAELRPLQNLRYQGPQSKHHLGSARRRGRSELLEYVIPPRVRSRSCHTSQVKLILVVLRETFLRLQRKKAILPRNIRWYAPIRENRLHWSIVRDCFELQPLHSRQRAGRLSGGRTDRTGSAAHERLAVGERDGFRQLPCRASCRPAARRRISGRILPRGAQARSEQRRIARPCLSVVPG